MIVVVVKLVHVALNSALAGLLLVAVQLLWLGLWRCIEQLFLGLATACCDPLVLVVRFNVEGAEHVQESARVEGQEGADALGESTVRLELNLNGVAEHDHELHLEVDGGSYNCIIRNAILFCA